MNAQSPITPTIVITALLAVFALLTTAGAVWGLVRGMVGIKTDDHPLCRRCGFDLTGKPAESTRCGECGADLAVAKSVRVGHRRRRVGLILLGLALGLLALGTGGGGAAVAVSGVDWPSYKPLWWLLHDADSTDPATRATALTAIGGKYDAGHLSPSQVRRLVARALDVQGDPARPWDAHWGDWVEREYAAGRLSAADWQRYARQALGPVTLTPRRVIRHGDPLWVSTSHAAGRVAAHCRLAEREDSGDAEWLVDGRPTPRQPGGSWTSSDLSGNGRSGTGIDAVPPLSTLPTGPHTLTLRRRVTVRDGFASNAPALATITENASAPFAVQDAPSVTLKPDPAALAAVLATLKASELRAQPGYGGPDRAYLNLSLDIGTAPMPVGLSHRVFVRAGGREWPLCHFSCPPGQSNAGYGTGGTVDGLPADAKTVDLVFRPDPAVGIDTTDVFEAWDQSFTLANVPLTRPASPPSTAPIP